MALTPLEHRLENVFSVHPLASADSGPANRWSNLEVLRAGIDVYVNNVIIGNYNDGYRKFYIDNPFGKETNSHGEPLVTFFGSIIVDRISPWRKDFEKTWWRLNSKAGVYSLVYIGNPYWPAPYPFYDQFDAGQRWVDSRDRRTAWKLLDSATRCALDAGFKGMAFDATSGISPDTLFSRYMWDLSINGIDVYVEGPHIHANKQWMQDAGFRTIATTWFDVNYQPNWFETRSDDSLPGSIIVDSGTPPFPEAAGRPPAEWYGRWVREILDRGLHPGIAALFAPAGTNPSAILGLITDEK